MLSSRILPGAWLAVGATKLVWPVRELWTTALAPMGASPQVAVVAYYTIALIEVGLAATLARRDWRHAGELGSFLLSSGLLILTSFAPRRTCGCLGGLASLDPQSETALAALLWALSVVALWRRANKV